MKEGSVFLVLGFPLQWPVLKPTVIVQEMIQGTPFIIVANEDGSLTIEVNRLQFKSQVVVFRNAHRALLSCIWNENKSEPISLHINGRKVSSSKKNIFVIESKPELLERPQQLSDKEIRISCETWLKWRKHRFSNPKTTPKKDRVIKDINSQLEELSNSIESLKSHELTFGKNESLYLANVLSILRSLLFWPDSNGLGSQYSPLLLRIAGYYNLPLPVYAMSDRLKEIIDNPLFSAALTHRTINTPSLHQKHSNEKMMDVQEWLEMDIIIDRNDSVVKTYRWKDLIFEGANSSSFTHFDTDFPVFIDKIKSAFSWERSMLFDYVKSIANITIELALEIKKAANNR